MVDYTPWLGPDWKPNWDKKNASMLICNHTSWVEIFYALHDHLPSFVARIGTKHTPIIGRFSDYLNSILLIDKVETHELPHLMQFSNIKRLISKEK